MTSQLALTHIARPYAAAVFQVAHADNQLASWDTFLRLLAGIAADARAAHLLNDPRLSRQQKVDWLIDICQRAKMLDDKKQAFLKIIARNRRFEILSALYVLFEDYKRAHEQSVRVVVQSATPLSDEQYQQLRTALKQRYQCNVDLLTEVAPQLIGGLSIQVGDEILDGSLAGQLQRLQAQLANPYQ